MTQRITGRILTAGAIGLVVLGMALPGIAEDPAATALLQSLFHKPGQATVEDFSAVSPVHRFDVVNSDRGGWLLLTFESSPQASFSPRVVRLGPSERATVTMTTEAGVPSFTVRYASTLVAGPLHSHTNRYRAYRDGETVQCLPVQDKLYASLETRTKGIFDDSKTLVTAPATPGETYIYTPGPFYRKAGIFARDFLYQLEGGGRDLVTAEEVRQGVDFLAARQLRENRSVGGHTYPKGAIPDHVYPDGRFSWGPGEYFGDTPGHFNRPSMDEAFCFVTLAWHAGYKAAWDDAWRAWFLGKAEQFVDAWNSAPRNPATGLITQWTTAGHIGANGIAETDGPCVMWGFHDSYAFPGDDLGTSVLACNAARALADMYDHASQPDAAATWSATADAMRDAIRAQFQPGGYLPWGVGEGAPTMASPDVTGYAVWSDLLTEAQADAASDWLAGCYAADKQSGGAADLFNLAPGCHGAVRMARKADDLAPGKNIWPPTEKPYWGGYGAPYGVYQNGGYWYYMSLGIAATLARKHPAEAQQWVTDTYADMAAADAHHPYERIDGVTPVNDRYNASVGQLLGMGMPAVISTISVQAAKK